MGYLSEAYPSLFLFILEHFKMTDRIEKYMAKCKMYETDPENSAFMYMDISWYGCISRDKKENSLKFSVFTFDLFLCAVKDKECRFDNCK